MLLYAETRTAGIPLLWVVLLVVMPLDALTKHHTPSPAYTVTSFFALPSPIEAPLAVEWTLQHEMFFYAIYAVLIAFPVARIPTLFAMAATSLTETTFFRPYPWTFLFSSYHLLFVFGVAITLVRTRINVRWSYAMLATGLCGFIAVYAYALSIHMKLLPEYLSWPYGIASLVIILSSVELEQRHAMKAPKWLVKLGDASYVLYLVHFPLIALFLKISKSTVLHYRIPLIGVYVFVASLAVFVSVILHETLELRVLSPLSKGIYRRLALR